MEQADIEKAIKAFRWTCPYNSILKRLDGTKEPYECFANDCKTRHYRCKGNVCHRLRRFINILKEPQQEEKI